MLREYLGEERVFPLTGSLMVMLTESQISV